MTAKPTGREAPILIALASLAALGLTYVIAVRTPLGQQLDTRVMLHVSRSLAGQTWTSTLLALVSPMTTTAATVALAAIALVSRGARAATTVLVGTAGTVVGAAILKALLVRPQYLSDAGNSLPSGHVAAVAGLAVAAALVAGPRLRGTVAMLGTAATALTGAATLALQWHRPSDVAGAVLLAIAIGALLATVPDIPAGFRKRQSSRPRLLGAPKLQR